MRTWNRIKALGWSALAQVCLLGAGVLPVGAAQAATTIDLGVSAYTWTPDPLVRGGASDFSVTVTNNHFSATADTLTLAINLPTNVDFSTAATVPPAGCTLAVPLLTCTRATLAAQATWVLSFKGVGSVTGVQTTTATVSSSTNTDPNGSNNALTKTTTVINGADLKITKTGPGDCVTCAAAAEDNISFNLKVENKGEDPATTFRVVDNLPALGDFSFTSAVGTGWSCARVSTTLTCDYSGPALAKGAQTNITVTGRVTTTAGSITNGASVASTDSTTGDPDQSNNGPSLVTVNVTQATDLRATKTMTSVATGSASGYALNEALTLTLSVTNQGPRNATGVTVSDAVPAGFAIGTLPAGCAAAGQTITCTVGNLANGATSANFVIPLTAPGSAGSGSNTATPARATPSAGNNTPATVNYTVAAATANLTAGKTMVSTANGTGSLAFGEAVTLTLRVTNSGPQQATGVTVSDTVPVGFAIGALPAGCAAAGQTITCTVGSLANGATSANFVIPLTAPNTVVAAGSNTATPERSGPALGSKTPATVNYTVSAPSADLQANKTMVSDAPGSTNGTVVYVQGFDVKLRLSATNNGLQDATGVTVSDTVPAHFSIKTVPAGCTAAAAPLVTCTVPGTLANGATSAPFEIVLTALTTTAAGSNTATVARATPLAGTNTPSPSVDYSIIAPYAHLTLNKVKTPTLVAALSQITSTITVSNDVSSSSPASGTIRVTDVLSANEAYVGSSPAGWVCNAAGSPQTVTCDYNAATLPGGTLARSASLPNLVLTTQANSPSVEDLSNTACTGLSASSPHTPPDTSNAGNCATRSAKSTPYHVDLSVTKTASKAVVPAADTSFSYTLTVSNAGPDVAPTVAVSDPLPAFFISGVTTGTALITGAVGGESCTFGATVACTLKNVAVGLPRTITITVNRTVTAGSFTNTATLSTPDAIDTAGVKSASVAITIDPVADVAVTNIAAAPNPVKVGVPLTYTTSIQNNGPDTAANVVLRHVINSAAWVAAGARRMGFVSVTAQPPGATCNFTIFGAGDFAGDEGVECTGFNLVKGETRQLVFTVQPIFYDTTGYPDPLNQSCVQTAGSNCAPFASQAAVRTSTGESTAANNALPHTAYVTTKAIDLAVSNNDPGFDPVAFSDDIQYTVKAKNNGPSQATGFKLTVTRTPPLGAAPDPYTMDFDAAGSNLPVGANCAPAGADVVCYLHATPSQSVLAANGEVTFKLKFNTGPVGNSPPSSITYATTAKVESYETQANLSGDLLPGNNTATETTTVWPKTDLHMRSKGVSKSVVNLNETFTYTLVVGNYGPAAASGVRVNDVLPAGLVAAGAVTVTPGAAVSLTTNTCDGAVWTGSCDLGPLPADTSTAPAVDATKLVTITIPVRAAYQVGGIYSFGTPAVQFGANFQNTARIAPLPNTSMDTTPGNDSNTVVVQVQKHSIAGHVYSDNDLNDIRLASGAEGINGVTLILTGTDSYGYTYGSGMTYPALTATTAGAGAAQGGFLFDNLPPGTWTLVETQPAGHVDRFELAGTAGGTVPTPTCNGTDNCASSVAANTIGNIVLPTATATAATGYLFQEYKEATVSGFVYVDANNNGSKDAGETGIGGVTLTLSGTDYAGQAVNRSITSTAVTGAYSFTVAPANAAGYTLRETQPGSHLNGKTTAGSATGTNAVAGTATGSHSDEIQAIKVYSNGASPNNNFGELVPATLSGFVFIDSVPSPTPDAQRHPVLETAGMPGLTMTLTGTDDLGAPVTTVATTTGNGAYSFSGLRPGSYTVTQTTLPSGLTHTGAQAGTQGGTIAGAPRTAGTGVPGLANTAISAITLASGTVASGYNFGESGQGLTGFVYLDLNGNGAKDAGEPGIAGVGVTLSGTTSGGQDVCVAISPSPCTVGTDASGQYSFIGLPASNAAGYTVTEQAQTLAPLNNYADGLEQLGTGLVAPGAAGNDVFSGVVLPVGGMGSNYNFGELGAKLVGAVYHDVNDNGSREPGEAGIAGVTLKLSGTTASGVDVCVFIAPRSCTVVTAADGSFVFDGLPASNGAGYTVTETQPLDYADRSNTVGSAGGTLVSGTVINGIQLPPGQSASGYLFGEKTGAISGYVYSDLNHDGVKDAAEAGIAGVTVTLTGKTASGEDVSLSAVTAADGMYTFSGLKNANVAGYTLTETQPASHFDGKETAGTQAGTVNNTAFSSAPADNRIAAIPFSAASPATGYNFGEVLAGSISGRVYGDQNDNSAYDAPEELPGVTLTLTGKDDQGSNVTLTTTTAADGSYTFSNLRPSGPLGYTITETQPSGINNFAGNSGTQVGTIAGNPVGASGAGADVISAIVLPSNGVGLNYNFREYASSLEGYVYRDDNDNGVKDGTENGLAGVTVTLTGGALATPRTAVTDATGKYAFLGLAAGTYTLEETPPAGYLDGRETAGTAGGVVDNTGFDNTPAKNRISAINLGASVRATGYLFGERGGTLHGVVYGDANNNALQDPGEPGLAGVTLTLSGNTEGGLNVCTLIPCVATTNAAGAFSFPGVPPGTYQLVENQADVDGGAYGDGKETAGVAGGVVDNTTQGSLPYQNTIRNIAITPAVLTAFAGDVGGYLFGEVPRTVVGLLPPILSGYVYMDRKHARVRPVDATLEGQAGWTVTLSQGGTLVCTVTSDANGFYQFDNLRCPAHAAGLPTGAGFSVQFSHGGNSLPHVATSGGNAGTAATGRITGITLNPNDEITEQNLPLDPAGVVYDVLTRQPVPGATVVISGPPGFNPATHLVGGMAAQSQVTGLDGRYSFWLQNAFPNGDYSLTVTSPPGYYPGASLILPPCVGGALAVGAAPNPGLVQQSNDAPALAVAQHAPAGPAACVGMVAGGAPSTQYYFAFAIANGVSAPILNNNIPLDPVAPSQLALTKTGDRSRAEVGDTVLYTIVVRNGTGAALPQATVKDRLPAGFTYVRGTARVNGVAIADPLGGLGPVLGFNIGNLGSGKASTLSYRVRIGVGSQQGTGINTARAYGCGFAAGCLDPASLQPLPHGIESNEGRHKVEVTGGVFMDEACVLGKVFVDCNNNHIQDPEELGIPGVRLYFEDGRFMVSDSEGKYSRCGLTPRSHVLTPDPATLPRGARLTTTSNRNLGDANSLFIDLKNGELHRADFAEGSCTNPVLEQVKARRSQGEVRSVETERATATPPGPALRFQSKPRGYPQQGTDSANQPLVQPRQGAGDAR